MKPATRSDSHCPFPAVRGRPGLSRLFGLLAILAATPGFATTTGGAAPWEAPLNTFLTSLTGPVASMVGVAAVVICGFAIAFSEGGSGLRKLVWVALGLSIAFAATTFFLPLFGYTAGLAI